MEKAISAKYFLPKSLLFKQTQIEKQSQTKAGVIYQLKKFRKVTKNISKKEYNNTYDKLELVKFISSEQPELKKSFSNNIKDEEIIFTKDILPIKKLTIKEKDLPYIYNDSIFDSKKSNKSLIDIKKSEKINNFNNNKHDNFDNISFDYRNDILYKKQKNVDILTGVKNNFHSIPNKNKNKTFDTETETEFDIYEFHNDYVIFTALENYREFLKQTKYKYHNNNKTQINSTMNHVVNYGPMRDMKDI